MEYCGKYDRGSDILVIELTMLDLMSTISGPSLFFPKKVSPADVMFSWPAAMEIESPH